MGRRPRLRPDFRHLETFLKVVETRSFVESARQLGVTQPAVSQIIARLEELYGGDLFERRRGAPIALTPIGKAILPKAKLLLFTVDQQISRALATAQSVTGSLTVGFYAGIALGPLSEGIAEFRRTRPQVALHMVEKSPVELYRELNERLIDLVFTAFVTNAGSSGNVQERMWDEPVMVAVQTGHQLSTRENVRWDDLSLIPILMRSHGGDLSAYRAVAARMGDRTFQCDLHDVSRGTIVEMVRAGLGVTLTFASDIVPRDGIKFLPIVDENSFVGIDVIFPKEDRNPLRHRLLELVRKHAPGVSRNRSEL